MEQFSVFLCVIDCSYRWPPSIAARWSGKQLLSLRNEEEHLALYTYWSTSSQISKLERQAWRFRLLMLLVLLVQASAVDIRGPHHPRSKVVPHTHHRPDHHAKITSDSKLLRDAKHIQEDLLSQGTEFVDLMRMTPEELEFHYFKLHDYDNNTKLDGLEILQAISHAVMEHPGIEHAGEDDFDYFVELIDRVLAEDDSNGDGYLSYAEYVVGRGKDMARRAQQRPATIQQHAGDIPAAALQIC